MLELGILVILGVFWLVTHVSVNPEDNTVSACHKYIQERRPLAKGTTKLVKCSVATPHIPRYRRSDALRIRAHALSASVAEGKKVIAAHISTGGVGACSTGCTVRTVVAGVVRDRKTLKYLEYDQPF